MPPHLQLTLLNVPSSAEGAASLPRPQHVILNHIYIQRGQVRWCMQLCWFCRIIFHFKVFRLVVLSFLSWCSDRGAMRCYGWSRL